jgi:hypothetical protein
VHVDRVLHDTEQAVDRDREVPRHAGRIDGLTQGVDHGRDGAGCDLDLHGFGGLERAVAEPPEGEFVLLEALRTPPLPVARQVVGRAR